MRIATLALFLTGCVSAPVTAPGGLTFVRITAGEFLMGSSVEEAARMADLMKQRKITSWYPDSPASEAPPRRTRISRDFLMSATEVTQGQFRIFVGATGYTTDAERDGKGADGRRNGKWTTAPEFNWRDMGYARADELPVVNVSWNDAAAYGLWLSKAEGRTFRLPTEAEWEYACRAGTSTRYYWGDEDERRNEFAWTGANNKGDAQPVGRLKPNAWGLFDMIGNAYEYVSDVFEVRPYDPAQALDPKGPAAGPLRCCRSGSWETALLHPRCAFRGGAARDHRNRRDGFRIVAELNP